VIHSALGLELIRIRAPDILAAVYDVYAIQDGRALSNVDGGLTI
jgi:hypothetical protein